MRRWPRALLVVLATIVIAGMLVTVTPGAASGEPGPLAAVDFTAASTNDDGSGGDGDNGGPPLMYDAWGSASSADPEEPGPSATRLDKDVAICTAGVRAGDGNFVDVTVGNGYPGYVCTISTVIYNGSGLPVTVAPAVLGADPGLVVGAGAQPPATLGPGGQAEAVFWVRVLQVAPQNGVLHFSVTITVSADDGSSHIIVDKITNPPGSTQQFRFDPDWEADFFLADGDTPHDSGPLSPGTYSVAEIGLPAGWSPASVVCSDGSSPAAIDLGPGETVTCTFTNQGYGRIIVDKATIPADATASFEFASSWGGFSLTGPGPVADSGLLPAGIVYSVAEVNLPAGWSPTSATCSDQSSPAAVGLSPGETVTCLFTNTFEGETAGPKASLTITKVATPLEEPDDTAFSFGGSLGGFTLQSGESAVFSELDAGPYTVSETLSGGWKLVAVECTTQVLSVDLPNGSVTVNLAEGEVAACTFTNSEQRTAGPSGSLTIEKEARPADDTVFPFDGGVLGDFELQDPSAPSVTFTELEAGAYTITELAVGEDWEFEKVECNADADWSSVGASVTVNLAEGEAAVCTFSNAADLPFTGAVSWLVSLGAVGLGAFLLGLMMLLGARKSEETA